MTTTTNARSYLNDVAPELVEVLANPEDDTPRLIYADWLEDRGEVERAEFIRVQCLREVDYRTTFNSAAGSNRAGCLLLRRYGWDWMGTDRYEAGWGRDLVWSRGFIAEVHAPLAVLKKHLPALVREHPIERVRADKEPLENNRGVFCWYREGAYLARESSILPEELWVHFQDDSEKDKPDRCRFLAYSTADAAHAALSVALLERAKGVNFAIES